MSGYGAAFSLSGVVLVMVGAGMIGTWPAVLIGAGTVCLYVAALRFIKSVVLNPDAYRYEDE